MNTHLKPIISKLTPEGRAAIDAAISLAVEQKHTEVAPAHLLMALLRQEGALFESLALQTGLSVDQLVDAVSHALMQTEVRQSNSPVFAKNLVEWLVNSWLLASASWGQSTLGSAAIFASLLEKDVTGIPHIQQVLHCDRQKAYAVLQACGGSVSRTGFDAMAETSVLEKYTRNLSELARRGELDPVLGREQEIRQMIDILLRRRQNNPILTGEPGVGKTALVEGLALRIAEGSVPPVLQSMELLTLDLGLLLAGASVKGEFENRLNLLLKALSHMPTPTILFIDEVHTLIGAGGQAGQSDAANLLKPALARGELRVIGATTWAEYKKYFEKDAALTRRFQVVKVAEPDIDNAMVMLRAVAPALSRHHNIPVLESAVGAAVNLSSRYIAGRQLPDKSVSLLDTACARVAVSQVHEPRELEAITVQLRAIYSECNALRSEDSSPERQVHLIKQAADLQIRHDTLHEEWQCQRNLVHRLLNSQDAKEIALARHELAVRHQKHAMVFERVDATCVADVVADWTGIPLGRMLEQEQQRQDALFDRLSERIIGQQHALTYISQQIRISRSGLGDPLKPTGVYLLAGPSGTGKTETSLALAELLFGGEHNLVTINMSEYQEAHTVSGLKGSPPGYVGYGQGGVLTEAVRRNPYSVILLDEVEKAHPDVMELFYQVFDKGVIEDAEGQVINFRNTLIIMTSNLASELLINAWASGERAVDAIANVIRPEFERVFSPALMGRMTLIPYLPLTSDVMAKIIMLKLQRLNERYQRVTAGRVSLVWSKGVINWVAQHCQRQQSGARDIDHVLQEHILPLLAARVLQTPTAGKIKISINNHIPCLKNEN